MGIGEMSYYLGKMKIPTKNESGGVAYKGNPKEVLTQLATTSCVNNTLYVSSLTQLNDILSLCKSVDSEYIGKLAVYSREKYHMRDIPALLCVILASKHESEILKKVFPRVIDNGTMLRKYFEMHRNGMAGRKCFGHLPKKLMIDWFNSRTPDELFNQSVGTPSMKDILRFIRPRPLDRMRSATYAWFVDRPYNFDDLPEKIQQFEKWKKDHDEDTPDINSEMLTTFKLSSLQWEEVARRASWKWLLSNLNTMHRHGLFSSNNFIKFVSDRLVDPKSIKNSKVFPYKILSAYMNCENIPYVIINAIGTAMDIATENVPSFDGIDILVDVSASMKFPITGKSGFLRNRQDAVNSKIRRVDVASLIACSVLKKSSSARIHFFNKDLVKFSINPKCGILYNANRIAKIADGGTACGTALKRLNQAGLKNDLVLFVSDDQSWAESINIDKSGNLKNDKETELQRQWNNWKQRNPNAKLVCVDIAPYKTTQVQRNPDILCLGGFSDHVYELIGQFVKGDMNPRQIVGVVESVDLENNFAVANTDEEE